VALVKCVNLGFFDGKIKASYIMFTYMISLILASPWTPVITFVLQLEPRVLLELITHYTIPI